MRHLKLGLDLKIVLGLLIWPDNFYFVKKAVNILYDSGRPFGGFKF